MMREKSADLIAVGRPMTEMGVAQKALLTEDAPPESKIRDSSKPSCSLYRLMRWSVLSQSDRVVRGDGENPKM